LNILSSVQIISK